MAERLSPEYNRTKPRKHRLPSVERDGTMKTLIVYFSKFGNTRRVAQAIAETMKQAREVRVVSIEQLAAADFEGVDLVVMGSPTHAFSVPQEMRSALATLPAGILAGKSVAAFDTTVRPWPLRLFRASSKLLRQLSQLGGKPVARPQTFFVRTGSTQGTGDRDLLLEDQIDRAQEWAGQILNSLRPEQNVFRRQGSLDLDSVESVGTPRYSDSCNGTTFLREAEQ